AILALELRGLRARRLDVGPLLDLDAKAAVGAGLGCAGNAAAEAGEGRRPRAARQPDDVRRLGDGADVGVNALVDRNKEDALTLSDVDRQRHRHVRENNRVLEWNQQ